MEAIYVSCIFRDYEQYIFIRFLMDLPAHIFPLNANVSSIFSTEALIIDTRLDIIEVSGSGDKLFVGGHV